VARTGIKIAAALAAVLLATTSSGQVSFPEHCSVNVTPRYQEAGYWCWAASGQMVMEFLGRNVSQCEQAENRFGRADCCRDCCPLPTGSLCNAGGLPEFCKYDFTFQKTCDAALTWDQVRTEIAINRKPFAFSWHYRGGRGHMMVAYGYTIQDDERLVLVNDPQQGNHRYDVTYEGYVGDGNFRWHWNDYYSVTPGACAVGSSAPVRPAPEPLHMTPRHPAAARDALKDSQQVAIRSLETYRKLAAEQGVPFVDYPGAFLREPFPVLWIGLDQLRDAARRGPADLLLDQVEEVLYPIQSPRGPILAAIVIDKHTEAWRTMSYGGHTPLAQVLVQSREKYQSDLALFTLVSVPALNVYLLAVQTPLRTRLIPLFDYPWVGLKADRPGTVSEVMRKLIRAAREADDLPA
jgi:hypothetical protein